MKKLTELDLQTALDECTEKRFRSHGDWLAGMVKRLNAVLGSAKPERLALKPMPFFKPPVRKITISTENSMEPEVPCIS